MVVIVWNRYSTSLLIIVFCCRSCHVIMRDLKRISVNINCLNKFENSSQKLCAKSRLQIQFWPLMGRGHDMHLINKRREYSFPTAVGGQTKTTDLSEPQKLHERCNAVQCTREIQWTCASQLSNTRKFAFTARFAFGRRV